MIRAGKIPLSVRLASWGGLLFLAVAACSDWPGTGKDSNPGTSAPQGDSNGVCSGTPLPCSVLGTADCAHTLGCEDQGSCTGAPTIPGESCSAQSSPSACNAVVGCFWSTVCVGTPFGTCSAFLKEVCLLAKGCVWTPNGSGGGAGCQESACTASTDCACGLSCVVECPGCSGFCGHPCLADTDCIGVTNPAGTSTPYCVKQDPNVALPYTGKCSQSRP